MRFLFTLNAYFFAIMIVQVTIGKSPGSDEINIIPEPQHVELLGGTIQFSNLTVTLKNQSLSLIKRYVENDLDQTFKIISKNENEKSKILRRLE